MAFGTAEHATTRGCLRLLDPLLSAGDRIADVGAGSGILSIAAARLGAREVLAFEMDGVACEVAEENVRANRVAGLVRVVEGPVHGADPLPESPFQGVLANLQRSILLSLMRAFQRSLVPGGWLILSGILLEEKDEILLAAEEAGFAFNRGDSAGEWWSGSFRPSHPPR
jgi:ribosomal protein L11 methyltransferase